jgi:hypothetical protein
MYTDAPYTGEVGKLADPVTAKVIAATLRNRDFIPLLKNKKNILLVSEMFQFTVSQY